MGDEMANWIKGAVKNKGALHTRLHIPEGQKISALKLKAAIKRGGKVAKAAKQPLTKSTGPPGGEGSVGADAGNQRRSELQDR